MEAAAVTPSDSTDLPNGVARALYIGGGGTVVLDTYTQTSLSFVGVQAGTILPVNVKRVRSTGTIATNLIALY
jgi:metal-dependent HD superfamily phosphatase/phosphodiesterase